MGFSSMAGKTSAGFSTNGSAIASIGFISISCAVSGMLVISSFVSSVVSPMIFFISSAGASAIMADSCSASEITFKFSFFVSITASSDINTNKPIFCEIYFRQAKCLLKAICISTSRNSPIQTKVQKSIFQNCPNSGNVRYCYILSKDAIIHLILPGL